MWCFSYRRPWLMCPLNFVVSSLQCTICDICYGTYCIWALCCCTLLVTINYLFIFLCLHMIFNNLSFFMSMSNLIQINIHFIDMKRHMLIFFLISMSMDREKEWGSFKMEVVFIKGGRYLLKKTIKKGSSY
jgi:hypothetical protein